MLREKKLNTKAQTLIEYSVIIGLVAALIVAMGPMIGRSTNSYIKVVADQIGLQNESEQDFDGGYLESSITTQRANIVKDRVETPGIVGYVFNDLIEGESNTLTNLGISGN